MQLNTANFVSRARKTHGLRFGYGLVKYRNSHTQVTIVCPEHGPFLQKPYAHLNGQGCAGCSGRKKLTTEEFVSAAQRVHGTSYDYRFVVYAGNKAKVRIVCPTHGEFLQVPNSHLSGRGCASCAKTGYNTQKPGTVYILLSECGGKLKVGITNRLRLRMSELRSGTPFHFVLMATYDVPGERAPVIEKWAHKRAENAGLKGFDGATEWVRNDLDFEYELHCVARQMQAAA